MLTDKEFRLFRKWQNTYTQHHGYVTNPDNPDNCLDEACYVRHVGCKCREGLEEIVLLEGIWARFERRAH